MEESDIISGKDEKSKSTIQNIFNSQALMIGAVVIIGIILIYFLWIFVVDQYEGCTTWECFNEQLASCEKTKFAGGTDIIFGYTIIGENGNTCEVEVEFLQGEIADERARQLIRKKMTCYLPLGRVMLPESDLSYCTGELKEELQSQIIDQLHNFIIQNVGQINRELLNPLQLQGS